MHVEYLKVEVPQTGEVACVAPGVHWLRMPLPFKLDHINLWLLDEGDGWTIVDTGIALDSVRAAWEGILAKKLGGRPVKRIIVTHCHPDHLGLARWLQDKLAVPVSISSGEFLTAHALCAALPGFSVRDMVAGFDRHGLDDAGRQALLARGNGYAKGVPSLPEAYVRLLDGEELRIGAHTWRVMMGYGHSPEHAALHCSALGVLISGDMVLPRISTNVSVGMAVPDGDPLRLYLDSIARYATLPDDTLVLPSHGHPFRGLRERVAALHAHHDERLAALEGACDVPRSAFEIVPVLFQRELDTHQVMFAMGEAMAHLNFLEHAGRVKRETSRDGVIRYTRSTQ